MTQNPPIPAVEAAPADLFLNFLPAINRMILFRLRSAPRRDREELHAAALAAAFAMFVRLVQRNKTEEIFATPLARYGVRHALNERSVGTPQNSRDIASRACRRKTGLRLKSLHRRNRVTGDWRELIVEDRQASPADVAVARIDFDAWLTSLPARKRQVAELLATGESTQDAAKHFQVSQGRISQLRRELYASWHQFQGSQPGHA